MFPARVPGRAAVGLNLQPFFWASPVGKIKEKNEMRIWKIVSAILSIVLCLVVLFQSCAAGLSNILSGNGDISWSAGLLVTVFTLVGDIIAIAA